MRYEIALKGSYALLRVFLSGGESVVAEPGAMVYMRGPIEVQTSVMGGVWKALKRAVLGGENFFMNTYVPVERVKSVLHHNFPETSM